jgi:hypothetical protein
MTFWQRAAGMCLMTWALAVTPAHAQLNTQHIKGTAGLKSGAQPPPHTYVIAPLIFVYNTDTVRLPNGNTLPVDESLTRGFVHVTTTKLLGGYYSFQVLFPAFANNRIQGTEIDANREQDSPTRPSRPSISDGISIGRMPSPDTASSYRPADTAASSASR